jgi:hypothetical protein
MSVFKTDSDLPRKFGYSFRQEQLLQHDMGTTSQRIDEKVRSNCR